jgi:transcriptional regulator with XRE-family HTH domain
MSLAVRKLRLQQKINQKELARRSGLSQSFLSELEKGAKKPSYDTLIKLAAALGVRVSDLLEESHRPHG